MPHCQVSFAVFFENVGVIVVHFCIGWQCFQARSVKLAQAVSVMLNIRKKVEKCMKIDIPIFLRNTAALFLSQDS